MAIQVDLPTSEYGVPFTGAYFRIVNASITRTRFAESRFNVMIDVSGYATIPAAEDTKNVDFRRYHCPLDEIEIQSGDNFLARCYQWVMAQPDMVGSIAV
jgi:hypothetical protein